MWRLDPEALSMGQADGGATTGRRPQLADGPRRVSDLVDATGLTQSNVSRHLACLWDCGLVERERHGREMHYRLVDGLTELLAAADRVLERTGDRVLACQRYGRLAARQDAA